MLAVTLSGRTIRALTLSLAIFAFGTHDVHADQAKIAAVNFDRILRDSAPAKAAQLTLQTEFATRAKNLQDMARRLKTLSGALDKNGATASEHGQTQLDLLRLDSDFQRNRREFHEDLEQRRNEALAAVLEAANNAIRQIAVQQHYDLVVREAVYVGPHIDMTDQVMKALAASSSVARSAN